MGLIEEIYGDNLHKKRQQSIAYAAIYGALIYWIFFIAGIAGFLYLPSTSP